jgi:20S proteasome alpha/beta subunit
MPALHEQPVAVISVAVFAIRHIFTFGRRAQVYPHGSTDSLPFATMGSGSLNAMAVFEANYEDGMSQVEGELLVVRAIKSGARA